MQPSTRPSTRAQPGQHELGPAQPGSGHAGPIGVFDSGVGGLSVLRALQTELSQEHFVYVADSAHAPYGERDDTYLVARARAVAHYLHTQHHIKALVVACNTATAAAIHLLRQSYPGLVVVGIEPALKPAVAHSRTGVVGVLATRSTLASDKFQRLLASLANQARFVVQACPGLALAIEHDDAIKIRAACADYTRVMGSFGIQTGQIDTLVLGCTHYPFAQDTLRAITGPDVRFEEAGAPVARHTRRLLTESALLAPVPAATTSPPAALAVPPTLLCTGAPALLRAAARRWLGRALDVQAVDIPNQP